MEERQLIAILETGLAVRMGYNMYLKPMMKENGH